MTPAAGSAFVPVIHQVTARRRESADTATFEILPTGGAPAPDFRPGQFNMLYAHGVGEIPVSISGVSRRGGLLHTVRAVGAVSRALCALRPGDELGVRGPFGTHWPVETLAGRSVVVMAGGLGLAPLRPAIRHLTRHRPDLAGLALFYGARTPRDVLFKDELRAWAKVPAVTLGVTVDRTREPWGGQVGMVTGLLPPSLPAPESWSALLCGPEVMMRHCAAALLRLGVPAGQVHLSLERNMKCALGTCGHCQLNRHFICRDGAVFPWPAVAHLLTVREL